MPKCPKCGHILSQPTVSGDFDAFWKAYPRKIGKKAAQKAYQSAVKGHPGLPDAILVAVGLQKAWDAWKGGYIPNPMTWLNQGRWMDEMPQTEQPEPERTADIRDLTEGDPAELTTRISKAWADVYGESPTTQTWELYEWVEVKRLVCEGLAEDDVLRAYGVFLKDKVWAPDRHPLSAFLINSRSYQAMQRADQ